MPRAPYRPVEETEALRPVAAPVDTFVQAQVPSRDTSLQDLARSLSGLGGSLGSFVGQRDKAAEEADRLRGEAAFHTSMGQGYAAGVASGTIPAQASQAFMQGYKRLEGEAAGGVLEQKFSAAYDAWEGKTSPDPRAYEQFLGGFLRDNIQTQDPDVLRGLLPKVHQLSANYLQRTIGDTSKAVMADAVRKAGAVNNQALEDANTAGLQSKTGTDYEGVFRSLEQNREGSLKIGLNTEAYDKTVVDGITSAATNLRDPKILDFMKRRVPGKDYTWEATPYGRDAKQKAIDSLETMGRQSIAADEKRRREEKTAEKDEVTRSLIQAVTKDPSGPLPEALLSRGEKVDPDFRVNAIRWRDTIGKGGQTSDNGDLLAVTTDILNGGGIPRVQRGMAEGVFKNPEDMTRAYKLAESLSEKDGKGPGDVLKVGSLKTVVDTIKKRTANDKNAEKYFDDGSMSDEGLQLTTDLKLQVLDWRTRNPEAGPAEIEAAVAKIGAGILGRIEQPGGDNTAVYANREGFPNANEFGARSAPRVMPPEAGIPATPGPRPAAQPPLPLGNESGEVVPQSPVNPPAAQPTAAAPARPATPPSTAPDAASWYRELPPETQRALEQRAAQQRKPLQQLTDEVYQRGVQSRAIMPPKVPGRQSTLAAPDGTPIETASTSTADLPQASSPLAGDIQRAFEGAYAGKTTFDGTTATLNGKAFTAPATPDQVARQFEGLDETNPAHRAALTAFLSKAAGQRIDPAKVPWCAAFVDSVLEASGKPTRGSLTASDFLGYGKATEAPSKGDVVVFHSLARGSSGHVGFVLSIEGDKVRYIAGNDDGKVQERTLPLAKVAGFRHPPEAGGGLPAPGADPKAARILDFISGAELNQENGGNYNAYFGHAASTEDLARRTLDETIGWSRNRGTSSSATGRFQFMADTLADLKTELGLSGGERFTPELQDRMALALLNRRGFREWTTGKLGTDEFANNLAKEWASLPNLATGRSHYAGDGVNKALVSPEQVRAALEGTGAFPAARLQTAARAMTAEGSPAVTTTREAAGPASPSTVPQVPAVDAYSNAPDARLAERLRADNPDPVGNSESVLGTVETGLAAVIRKAQADNPRLRFVVVSRSGEGAEVLPVDAEGRLSFAPDQQAAVAAAIRRSAVQLGAGVNIGGGTAGGQTLVSLAATTRV